MNSLYAQLLLIDIVCWQLQGITELLLYGIYKSIQSTVFVF